MGIIRLTDAGAILARSLFSGSDIGEQPSQIALARRLIDRGMAHPVPNDTFPNDTFPNDTGPTLTDTGPILTDLTVIMPVHDDHAGLRRSLAALPAVGRIVIIDDCSATPVFAPADATNGVVTVIRNDHNLGPAGSRNRGLAEVDTAFVLFLDAGVVVDARAIETLLSYFADNTIVAAGPRIVCRPGANNNAIDRYELDHSPLDLGPLPSLVRPGARVSYLPTACLLVRHHALREVGPFDPALRYGEDVDLIWRLRAVGSVRYVPSVVASHPARSTIIEFAKQRIGYGSAAGPLGVRHGGAVAPLRSSKWTLSVLALVLGGHYSLAALLHSATTRLLVPKLGAVDDRALEAARLTTTGNAWAARTVARSGLRAWWPVLAVGLALSPTRSIARRWLWFSVTERVCLDRETDPRLLALGLLDDLSYGSGVWVGALRSRSLTALLPATNDQSTSGRFTIKSSNWTTSRVSTLRRRMSDLRSSSSHTTAIGKCDG